MCRRNIPACRPRRTIHSRGMRSRYIHRSPSAPGTAYRDPKNVPKRSLPHPGGTVPDPRDECTPARSCLRSAYRFPEGRKSPPPFPTSGNNRTAYHKDTRVFLPKPFQKLQTWHSAGDGAHAGSGTLPSPNASALSRFPVLSASSHHTYSCRHVRILHARTGLSCCQRPQAPMRSPDLPSAPHSDAPGYAAPTSGIPAQNNHCRSERPQIHPHRSGKRDCVKTPYRSSGRPYGCNHLRPYALSDR